MEKAIGIPQKGSCHSRALTRWIKAGRPVRSQEQIQEIYGICQQCRALDATTNFCKYCGCRVANHPNLMLNRIAIATERCPVGKWPLESDE